MPDSGHDVDPGGGEGDGPSVTTVLLGALGSLQAVVAALGVAVGGLTAVALNNEPILLAAVFAILLAFIAGALTVFAPNARWTPWAQRAGVLTLAIGLLLTAYVTIETPSRESDPSVDVSFTRGNPDTITVTVSASGVPRNRSLQVAVVGLRISGDEYLAVPPAIYHSQLGADNSGDVKTSFSIPVPRASKKFGVIDIDAWTGDTRHLCGFKSSGSDAGYASVGEPKPTIPSETQYNEGCALVQLPSM